MSHRAAPRRLGDPPVLVADSSRAGRLLGFSAPHSGVETIVRTTHAWLAGGSPTKTTGLLEKPESCLAAGLDGPA